MADNKAQRHTSNIENEEHNPAASAKSVVIKGFDGSSYPAIKTDANGAVLAQIVDGAGAELELIKENDNFNAASHGIIMYGLDRESNPQKYRQINADEHGHIMAHIVDANNNVIDPSGGNPLDKFAIYADETTATYYYYCGEDKDGNWYISRETLSTHITDYATPTNQSPAINPNTVTNAWTNRATLDYGLFSAAF